MVSDDLKDKVEVVLFSAGKKININEVSKLVKEKDLKLIEKALEKLQKEYNDTKKSLMVVREGEEWKLTVRERYLDVAKKIVADTELPKTIIETLAVIAWKQPVLQSEIIKVRTNKAYDHIKELERIGFLSSKKKSRTRELKLSEKFYKYFELSGDKDIRDMFSGIQGKAIDKAATYVEKKEKEKQTSEQKAREEAEITRVGKLKVVDVEKKKTEELPEQTIGDLEVYDEPSESEEETLKKPEEAAEEEVPEHMAEEPEQEESPTDESETEDHEDETPEETQSDESETEEPTEEKLDVGEETTDIEPTEESTAETVPEGPVEAEFSDVTDETEEEKQEESEPEAEEPEKADEEKTEKKKSSEEEFNIDEVIDYHSK